MDEPFSQVDALTAETLRNEVISLWRDARKSPRAILLVSHDIHEAAFMASRILIMSANPGRLKAAIENPMPYPRDPRSSAYQGLVDRLHDAITGVYLPEQATEPRPATILAGLLGLSAITSIPMVEVREMIGLLDAVRSQGGDVEFFRLTAELGRAFTRILLAAKAAELLQFLETPQDHLVLTERGRQFLAAPRAMRKQLFREQLLQVPLVKRMREMLEHSPERRLAKDILLEELAIQCPQEDPKRLLRILINWGRFADLWTSTAERGTLTLLGAAASK
jgi:NitT/TauT family transport system ATP-binding protein